MIKTDNPEDRTPSQKLYACRDGITGKGASQSINWKAESNFFPSSDEIVEAQYQAGYPVGGYGGPYNVKIVPNRDGTWTTTWNCWACCD